jgi:hypothetical protein
MNKIIKGLAIAVVLVLFSSCKQENTDITTSNTNYAQEALQRYVDSGQLPGAISVLYKDGIQEVCCIGYADVESKRPITMNSAFMRSSSSYRVA